MVLAMDFLGREVWGGGEHWARGGGERGEGWAGWGREGKALNQ